MICQYVDDHLWIENVPLADIAREFGTPCYVYSASRIRDNFTSYQQAFGDRAHSICYAVKANSNLAILDLLRQLGAGNFLGRLKSLFLGRDQSAANVIKRNANLIAFDSHILIKRAGMRDFSAVIFSQRP